MLCVVCLAFFVCYCYCCFLSLFGSLGLFVIVVVVVAAAAAVVAGVVVGMLLPTSRHCD